MKYFTSILIRVFIILFFVACGGDNSQIDSNTTIIDQERSISLNEPNYTETTVKIPDNIIGVVQKGLFIDGTIKAQYIDKNGELSGESIVGDIDDKGTYSLYLTEDGLVSLKAKGKFFNEYRGENSTEEAELFALFKYKKSDNIQKINLNLFSSLEYRRVLTLMQEEDNFQKALESTRVSMKTIFGLSKESKTTDLDIYDLNGTLKDENINLLLLSGAFLKSIDSESSISKQSKIVKYKKGSTGDNLDDFLSKFGTKGSMTGSSNWNRMIKYDMGVLFTQMASNLDLGYKGEDYNVEGSHWGYTPPVVIGNPVVIGGGGVRNPPPPPPADITSFITTWKTDNQGASDDNEIIISTKGSGYNYDIDWTGDGTWDTIGATGTQRHAYPQAGTYTVKIRGQFPRIYSDYQADRLKILSVEQWGNIEWQSMEEAFSGSKNLKINATDAPDLSRVTNMNNMLINTAINMEDLSSWDVSHVTTMINLFSVTNFNGDIRNWDVSSVTNMSYMFGSAKIFDQDIGDWNVSSVTDMLGMFNFAENFNQDISRWNVSHVESMNSMFRFTNRFDQDISRWDTHNVTNMGQMFASAINFNQDISHLDISSVINMSGMFSRATKFDQDISRWNISNVQDMTAMFLDSRLSTTNYDALLESWSTQPVQANILFHGGLSKYCRAKSARESLIDAHGWTISDGGEDCNNHAPTITSTNSIPIEENRRVVLTIVGEDIDGDSLTYSIIGGVDQDKFNIDPTLGTLSFTIIPDFENSIANYSDNMYEVKIQVTDTSGLSATQNIFVHILDDTNENGQPFMITSPFIIEVNENEIDVQTVTANRSPLMFSIIAGLDSDQFTNLTFTDPRLKFKNAPDFENPQDSDRDNIYKVRINVYHNNQEQETKVLTIIVKDTDDNPPTSALDLIEADDTGSSHTDNITKIANPTFNVECPAKDVLIRVYANEILGTDTYTCQGNGVESLKLLPDNLSLTHGVYRLKYTYQPKNGVESDFSPTLRVVIDRLKPKNLPVADLQETSDTGSSQTDNTTSIRKPTFDIKCDGVDSIIEMWVKSTLAMTACTSADKDSILIHNSLADGTYEVIYHIIDIAGNKSDASPSMYILVDGTAPNIPTLTTPTNGAVVTGTAEAGTLIRATTPTSSCTTTVDANGDYSCTLSPAPVNFEAVEVIATDEAGNSSPKAIGEIRGVTTNHPPVITSGTEFIFYEGEALRVVAANINAEDPDVDILKYTILPMNNGFSLDHNKFNITEDGGVIYFNTIPDYEFPINFDKDNIYQVNVKVTDSRGGEAYSLVNITVKDSVRIKDTTFTPEKYANDVEIDSDISIHFIGKTIARGTGSIKIFKKNGDEEHTNFDVNVAQVTVLGDSLIIDPNADFEPETEYYILIDKGAIKDTNGVDYIGITNKEEWKFTTGKAPEPENPCGCPDFACFVN